ncbi:MAG TPA: glycosyltransferase family 4 protein, partial [Flavobacterium sp.]|nr:glycosyltransferase family 4 protein [Flavobacterium sp.]
MHICFVSHEYPVLGYSHGGIGTLIRDISYKLVAKGHQVSIARLSPVRKYKLIDDNGVAVHLFPESNLPFSFLFNSLIANQAIYRIHKQSKIDIVETPELGLAFFHKIKDVKYVIRMHGGHHFFTKAENRPLEWKKVWQEKRSFAKADAIIAVSNYVAETTRKLLELGDVKITVIYNPIDTGRFYEADNNKVEKHSLFFAGTLIEKKGIRQLVQSLEFLVDEFPDIKLRIAGRDANIPGTNAPYRPVLEKAISEKIRPHIEFLGSVPNFEIPNYIEKSQICCYPSHMEAMPLAWLEVLAMGKVFLASSTGPGPEAVLENKTGFL